MLTRDSGARWHLTVTYSSPWNRLPQPSAAGLHHPHSSPRPQPTAGEGDSSAMSAGVRGQPALATGKGNSSPRPWPSRPGTSREACWERFGQEWETRRRGPGSRFPDLLGSRGGDPDTPPRRSHDRRAGPLEKQPAQLPVRMWAPQCCWGNLVLPRTRSR